MATEFCFLVCSMRITRFDWHLEIFLMINLVLDWEKGLEEDRLLSPKARELPLARRWLVQGSRRTDACGSLMCFLWFSPLLNLLVLVPKSWVLESRIENNFTGENENFMNAQGVHTPWPQDCQQHLLCELVLSIWAGNCCFSSALCGGGRIRATVNALHRYGVWRRRTSHLPFWSCKYCCLTCPFPFLSLQDSVDLMIAWGCLHSCAVLLSGP